MTKKFIAAMLFLLLSLTPVLAGNCEDRDFQECHEGSWGNADSKLVMSFKSSATNPNDIKKTDNGVPYVLVQDGFKVRYECRGTNPQAYLGPGDDCDYGGCPLQSISSKGTITIGDSVTDQIDFPGITCYGENGDDSSWVWFLPMTIQKSNKNVHILNCGQDGDCSNDEVCDSDGYITRWSCEYVQCTKDSDCTPSETCIIYGNPAENYCEALSCNDYDPCTKDFIESHSCKHEPIYVGECSPCYGVDIDDGDACTEDLCDVVDGVAEVTHTEIEGCRGRIWIYLISGGLVVITLIVVLLKVRKKK